MAETDMAGLFAQHQPDDYGGDSIQCQGCHPRRWFAGWREFAAHLASLSDERLAQAEEKVGLACKPLGGCVGAYFLDWQRRANVAEAKVRAVKAILSDVTDESATDGYVALADARGDKLGRIGAALSGDAAPRQGHTMSGHRDGCSCHDVPRELSSCTCFGPDAPADTTHLLRPGGSRLPNGGGWSCTGCGWVFSYDVALARAQEVWAADQRHQPT